MLTGRRRGLSTIGLTVAVLVIAVLWLLFGWHSGVAPKPIILNPDGSPVF